MAALPPTVVLLRAIRHHGRPVDRYTLKRRLMRPVTAWRRHRAHRLGPINAHVWAAQNYSAAMRRFYFAVKQNPQLLVDVDLPSSAMVLDLGAYEGSWSMRLLNRPQLRDRDDVRIHAFEPEPSAVERCREATAAEPRFELHPFGLAGRRRCEQLTVDGPGSSIYADHLPVRAHGSVAIELRDVAEVLDALDIGRIDLIKINIEGGEFELLDRLHETDWLRRINTLIVQFHEFAPDAYRSRRRNRKQLQATHRCTWNYSWVYERWDLA
jgi:FkbM family methyltransferase